MKEDFKLSANPAEYQETELGPLPVDWQVVRLGDTVELTKGRKPPQLVQVYKDGFIPYLTADYFRNRIAKEWIPREYASALPCCSVEDVVLIWDGSKAGQVFTGLQGVLASTMVKLEPKPGLRRDYLFFLLLTLFDLLNTQTTGTTIPHVNKELFRHLPIPLPPLPEQRAIAHVLRTVQQAREATERVIAALRALKKSLMRHLFTYGPVPLNQTDQVPLKETEIGLMPAHWQVVRVGEVVERTRQVDPRKTHNWEFKYVDVSSVSNESLRVVDCQICTVKDVPSRARKEIKAGDVIFATVRPYLKRIARIQSELDGQICSTAFCVLRPNSIFIDGVYLFFAVSRDEFVINVSEYQRGSSYPAVTDNDVKRGLIPLPPLPEQQEIARILRAVDARIQSEERYRQALEALFKTLLHELMTAKRRVPEEYRCQFQGEKS